MHENLERIFKELEEYPYTKKLTPETVLGEFSGFSLKLGGPPEKFTTKTGLLQQISEFYSDVGILYYFVADSNGNLDIKKCVINKNV